ncbi:PREDICTED: polymeric immunoglobulin receptor [Condylura cristata]|uniref:polymeric immunoglobulin receptor n=1 Tax=Condylura cristata TaxID=143302 RepID=UPI000334460B|nr:PREDICTED: polymeric immunoglobulin receptor [Condylura cristata]
MSLFFLTCLLAVFPVVSMKSPIFGPHEVKKVEGSSALIRCFYPATSVNRHTRKYWCRQFANGACVTIISSDGYISKNFTNRIRITNFPENNTFEVNIANLRSKDSGSYKCGLGINNRGLSFDVNLKVFQGKDPGSWGNTKIYTAVPGTTLTIDCPFKPEDVNKLKNVFWKPNSEIQYSLIANSNGYLDSSHFKDRLEFKPFSGTSESKFILIIKHLQPTDAGSFMCSVDNNPNPQKEKEIRLQILTPGPELVYADLRSSVRFDCALGSNMEDTAIFLCRMNNNSCNVKNYKVVINTVGDIMPTFEGRVRLAPKSDGSFSVLIVGLQKEDAGHYVCGTHRSGQLQEDAPIQAWHLFVKEETSIPPSPSVITGVKGGSVAVRCPYNPKERDSDKYWCRWKKSQSGDCPLLVHSEGVVQAQLENYKGRLALHEEPGNGTFTVILNQLTAKDAGFYWCLTSGDDHWTTVMKLEIVDGKPKLQVPKDVIAREEEALELPCNVSCQFYSSEKYWCKWTDRGCKALPSQDKGPNQPSVYYNQKKQLINLVLNPVTEKDEGWYWCGVKDGPQYKDTAAVHVTVNKVKAVPGKEVSSPRLTKIEKTVNQDPRLLQDPSLVAEARVVEDSRIPDEGSRASPEAGSSTGQSGGSTILVSTLVPLALVLALGAMALAVARIRHRRNVDRMSIRSFRADISMSDLENSRDFGANDNMGTSLDNQETSLGRKDATTTTTEQTTETEEPKKAKRSSKEEADMAYTAFLFQSNTMAAGPHDGPSEA